jgi:hypothetical protein
MFTLPLDPERSTPLTQLVPSNLSTCPLVGEVMLNGRSDRLRQAIVEVVQDLFELRHRHEVVVDLKGCDPCDGGGDGCLFYLLIFMVMLRGR